MQESVRKRSDLQVQEAPEGDRLIHFICDEGQQVVIRHLLLLVSHILCHHKPEVINVSVINM